MDDGPERETFERGAAMSQARFQGHTIAKLEAIERALTNGKEDLKNHAQDCPAARTHRQIGRALLIAIIGALVSGFGFLLWLGFQAATG